MNCIENARLCRENIQYIGEGNASVVLRLKDTNKVLKLKKSLIGKIISSDEFEHEKLVLQREYIRIIIRPCFETDVVIDIPEIVNVQKDGITRVSRIVEGDRPFSRSHKELSCPYAFLYTNYTMPFAGNAENPTLCIEIKCKRGFMPKLLDVHGKCTFCLMQYLKLEKGKISSLTEYCPLDLFSGNKDRMSAAIFGLFTNPQNNMKIFMNSELIFSEGSEIKDCIKDLGCFFNNHNMDVFCLLSNILVNILMCDMSHFEELQDRKRTYKTGVTCNPQNELPHGCILERIVRLQKLSENVKISDVDEDDFEYLKSMIRLNPIKLDKNNFEGVHANCALSLLEKELNNLQKYFLSATFCDCSIMIAFKRCENHFDETCKRFYLGGASYSYNVAIADMDAKPFSKIKYHKRIESEMKNAYLKHFDIFNRHV